MPNNSLRHERQWERVPAEAPVRLVLKADRFKSDSSAIALDLSVGGMRVRTNLDLAPGEWVGIVPKGEFPHAIPARVVWAREDETSHWIFAGLEFLQTREA